MGAAQHEAGLASCDWHRVTGIVTRYKAKLPCDVPVPFKAMRQALTEVTISSAVSRSSHSIRRVVSAPCNRVHGRQWVRELATRHACCKSGQEPHAFRSWQGQGLECRARPVLPKASPRAEAARPSQYRDPALLDLSITVSTTPLPWVAALTMSLTSTENRLSRVHTWISPLFQKKAPQAQMNRHPKHRGEASDSTGSFGEASDSIDSIGSFAPGGQ